MAAAGDTKATMNTRVACSRRLARMMTRTDHKHHSHLAREGTETRTRVVVRGTVTIDPDRDLLGAHGVHARGPAHGRHLQDAVADRGPARPRIRGAAWGGVGATARVEGAEGWPHQMSPKSC